MPTGKEANALEKLLIEKYGVPPDEAYDYAAEIIADKRGGLTGDRGKYLQQEALANVAHDEQVRINELIAYVDAIQGGVKTPYDEYVTNKFNDASVARTHQEALRVHQEREAARQAPQLTPAVEPVAQRSPNYYSKETAPQVQAPPTGLAEQIQAQNPHERRLLRAMNLRKAVLGE